MILSHFLMPPSHFQIVYDRGQHLGLMLFEVLDQQDLVLNFVWDTRDDLLGEHDILPNQSFPFVQLIQLFLPLWLPGRSNLHHL